MKKNKKVEEFASLNINMIFVVVVFLILLGVVGLIIGAIYLFMGLGLVQFDAVEFPVWLFVLILSVASITLGTLMSYFMSKFVLKASNRVVKGLERLASGNFSERINLGDSVAHVQLSDAFNKLAKELEDTKMLRSDFINEFAHEFKTPIVSIKGFAELLTQKDITEEQRKEYLNIIIEETSRLSSLAHNYLALTKVEKQNILTDLTGFNLSEQIRSSLVLLENKWCKKGLTPEFEGDEIFVKANEELLKQVWINLIDNAIKFSYENTSLKVSVEQQSDKAIVSITNYGQGIDECELSKIYDKFYRVNTAKNVEGSGVGLAIVKKVVELHNGHIKCESNEGQTTFEITIPRAY